MAKPAVLIFTAELVEQNMLKSIDVSLQSGLISSDHKSSHNKSNFSFELFFFFFIIIFLNVNLFNMS